MQTLPSLTPQQGHRKLSVKWLVIAGSAVAILIAIVVILIWLRPFTQPTVTPARSGQQSEKDMLLGSRYTDKAHKVSLRFPKGWIQGEKSKSNPYSIVAYQNPQVDTEGKATGHASSDLSVEPASVSLDDYMRRIIESTLNVSLQAEQIEHKRIVIGNQTVRTITYDIPGPGGAKGRITHFVFVKNDTFYDLAFTFLASKYDTYKDAIGASIASVQIQ